MYDWRCLDVDFHTSGSLSIDICPEWTENRAAGLEESHDGFVVFTLLRMTLFVPDAQSVNTTSDEYRPIPKIKLQ